MGDLKSVDSAFETRLRALLPDQVFRPLTPTYQEEPRGLFHGEGGLVLAPSSVDEVSAIVRECAAARVPVVPFGGGTGLVGGQIMPGGAPVILSLERMTRIRAVHPSENVLVAEAGAILADVQAAAGAAGRLFPLSLASEGSCRIGGCLSTNAGGVNVLRYGSARDLCLGVEAVLPDGSVHHGLRRLRKDNTGFDLRALLCGAEGTLGVITAASLRLFPKPARQGTAFLNVRDPAAALDLLALAQDRLGQGISAFELIKGTGLDFLAAAGMGGPQPFTARPDWSVLIELGLGPGQDPEAELATLFVDAESAGLTDDGVIAQSDGQRTALWKLREEIPLANKAVGAISSHDISLPLSAIADFLHKADADLARAGTFRVNAFGHLGDGNLHYNVFPPDGQVAADFIAMRQQIRDIVYGLVQQFDGSFSAEHGIGRLKPAELRRYGDPARLAAMRKIKDALDPMEIMNPGVIFN
ncbi:FAD-binding oxidoreductase [Aliiroseovarius sp. Z3]|uniref:FAD-binding oxidoreductase n=1 Tax=Aliiroseovarius sp. Z3 TaxID=2811402 RepID=UPI0023B234D0|nr:FAD-binding oxidoreductase [Aliiroseovarius sp. Z3]MDE9451714.1 FAD-binding oxidoreductase [Aliiroseovarius sp. Z3]